MSQRGAVHLIPLLLILAAIVVVILLLVSQGAVKIPLPESIRLFRRPAVGLKTEYKNPFEKDTQYVNPFSEYKNPFDNLK